MNIEISDRQYWKELKWDDAMLYCQLLVIDGVNDWRLPTKDEMGLIYENGEPLVGYHATGERYWICQNGYEEYEDMAWAYDFFGYEAQPYPKDCYWVVIPVRDV